jgi:hypothetical protein
MARKNGIHVHLLKNRAFVFDFAARNGFQLRREFLNAFAAMGFNDADNYILTAIVATDGLTEHAVGFADTRGIAEEKFEHSLLAVGRRSDFKPIFRLLGQEEHLPGWKASEYDRIQACCDF